MQNPLSLVLAGSLGAVGIAMMEADEELPGEKSTEREHRKDSEDQPGEGARASKDAEQ